MTPADPQHDAARSLAPSRPAAIGEGGGDPIRWENHAPERADVLVVGGGFSGLLTLLHLRRTSPDLSVAVIERSPRRWPGIAYGSCDPHHLLNVPANRMGAWPDDPAGFHRWLEGREPGRFAPNEFVPRVLYGEYLSGLVAAALAGRRAGLSFVRDTTVALEARPDGVVVLLASGRRIAGRALVLAPGITPGRAPWAGEGPAIEHQRLVDDPWSEMGGTRQLPPPRPDREILIVGSGLTAIDVVGWLRRQGHRGPIRLVSRNGRLPLPHADPSTPPAALASSVASQSPLEVLRTLRRLAQQEIAAGRTWQPAVDAIRPHVATIWHAWSAGQRAAFLRHIRPQWEVHRHRAPAHLLAALAADQKAGLLRLERGRLVRAAPHGDDAVRAVVEGREGRAELLVDRVYNCIGPTTAIGSTSDPLLRSLLDAGTAVADPAGLGLRSAPDGRLLAADGSAQERLFVVGALRRADLWESTAVPELRLQTEQAGRSVAALLALDTSRSPSR